ncbi:MAG: ImmA/IrrE family metallo-endopeptidase [Thermoleophilia bacterium]
MIRSRESRRRAQALLEMLNISKPPVDVNAVAKSLGFEVLPYDFPDDVSAILMVEDGEQVIGVNKNHPEVRQRFSIAHELGHFISGHDDFAGGNKYFKDGTFNYGDSQNRSELEANEFAAELVMPEKFLREDVINNGLEVPNLAKKYNVSQQALWIQLINLKLADKG